MANKDYVVHFFTVTVGTKAEPLLAELRSAFNKFGSNLPEVSLDGHGYQVRNLKRAGHVWSAMFAQLRDDAPHVVTGHGTEHELTLEAGDRLLERCHFLYYERSNTVVWQSIRNIGGTSRFQNYLSQALQQFVSVNQVQNEAELDRVLAGQLYELQFQYARPQDLGSKAPEWSSNMFDILKDAHAATARFMLRAPKNGSLAKNTRTWVTHMVKGDAFKKVRVKLTDESKFIDLFLAPLKDSIRVELNGRYPHPGRVFEALNDAYDRQRASLPDLNPTP
jgi:hypothetical protein